MPLFMFLGDKDENDSVPFREGYEKEDEDLICAIGITLVERWEVSKKIYRDEKLNAEFTIYPNVMHTVTNEMYDDIRTFFSRYTGKYQ